MIGFLKEPRNVIEMIGYNLPHFVMGLGVLVGIMCRKNMRKYTRFYVGLYFGVVSYHWSYQIYRIIMEKYFLPKIY